MTNQYFLARIVGRDPDLRAADADREQVAERLRKGHSEGRLDMDEFQERLERCFAAKTMGELAQLVGDLPRLDDRDETSWGWPRFPSPRLVALTPILIVLLIIAAAGGHHVFWLWLPIVFLVLRLSSWRRRRWADARRGPGGWI